MPDKSKTSDEPRRPPVVLAMLKQGAEGLLVFHLLPEIDTHDQEVHVTIHAPVAWELLKRGFKHGDVIRIEAVR